MFFDIKYNERGYLVMDQNTSTLKTIDPAELETRIMLNFKRLSDGGCFQFEKIFFD